MKHLFIARHGQYDYGNNRINDYGRKQMEFLGAAIKQALDGGSAFILSSTAPRALDSSQILAVQLGLPPEFEQIPYLWSGTDAPKDSFFYKPNLDRVMGFVAERRERADGLIMVTHLEVAEEFPGHFVQKEFGQARRVGVINKGQAAHINLEKREVRILPGTEQKL